MRYRIPIVAAAFLGGLLHIAGIAQVRQEPFRGYRADQAGLVAEVKPGGPAERAGLRTGDRILRIGGIDVRDRQALDAQPRPKIGESRSIRVGRDGRAAELRLTYSGLPPMDAAAYLVSGITGLTFLGFGLWAYFRIPRRSTTLLALLGIGVGSIFTQMPYVGAALGRALMESGLIIAGLFGFAALFHFTLVFPKERRILHSRATVPAIYAPAVLVSVGRAAAMAVPPGESGGPASLMTILSLVLVLVYFLLATLTLVRSYARATRLERAASGLNFLVACLLLGCAPMIPTAVALAAPGVVFPGGDYYDVTWVLIPFALARATIRQARSASMEMATP